MSLLAAVRPDDWNLPLFLHVLGAMVLVGALGLVALTLAGVRGEGGAAALRLGYRSLLLAALPAWLLMRLSAEWVLSEENLGDDPPNWVDIGFMTSESSLLLLIGATVCAGLGVRRARRGGETPAGLTRAATVLVAIALLAYLVAIWAMTTKPT